MSYLLWKFYLEDDVEKFRRLLANTSQTPQQLSRSYGAGAGHPNSFGSVFGSPGGAGSPKSAMKNRKVSASAGGAKTSNTVLGRAELNHRDFAGLTILHRAASSTSANAISFALALIEHPAIDLYIQDLESGWTALHRALYFGNISIARAIIERDRGDSRKSAASRAGLSVIKVKDYEGNSPFDVYNATIARRSLQQHDAANESDTESEDGLESGNNGSRTASAAADVSIDGDELFVFGSNKNHSLGFSDGDDRQHPERIFLQRPEHLLFRFYREYIESNPSLALQSAPRAKILADLPALILNKPVIIQDVVLSKLHSAILTTDPEANLYMCGFGPGGRLGTGDEVTRFTYTCIEDGGLAGKRITAVALGQNHTLAVTATGDIFSWGTSTCGQLGYNLPRPSLKDEDPICTTPRQIFGPLKREVIIGVAASAVHSVAYTSNSLFCWGKNEGQLGLMDSDSRSLSVQPVPRKVGASLFKSAITSVSAINDATICLTADYTVCVFSSYGYNFVKFPLFEGFSNYHLGGAAGLTTRYEASNHISSITAGGNTVAAISSRGDLYTVNVRKVDSDNDQSSTTNPSKIKSALSAPQKIWSLRKGNWDGIKSVGVSENGSVIVCTQAGAVWRRVKRAKTKDAFTTSMDFSRKDFKFQRVPGLTHVTAVRSNVFGAYAAIRKDSDITRSQIVVEKQNVWQDIGSLLSIRGVTAAEQPSNEDTETPRFWTPALPKDLFDSLKRAVLTSSDIESDVSRHLKVNGSDGCDVELCTNTSEVAIPVHGFILSGRSSILREALTTFRMNESFSFTDVFLIEKCPSSMVESSSKPKTRFIFRGLDFITIMNLAVYLYTDTVVDVWQYTRQCPKMAFRYRQVRLEMMKLASHLGLPGLELAARLMRDPELQMNKDMDFALTDPAFLEDSDILIELDGSEVAAHSQLLCQRCPFFEGLFNGRAKGKWLEDRRRDETGLVRVDLKHVEPDTFSIVLRYLYADVGVELFDDIVSTDIDEFSELVLDVMAIADELMLDRLSQICQKVIGRFVNTRNVSQLLNVVAPCSVREFKDAALEYLCLQLESILENHLIDDLDEDLLLALNEVVRGNQLNCLPFAKSLRAEELLHDRHPELAADIDEERQRRVRDMTFRANLKDDDHRVSSSFRARVGSLDEHHISLSPSQEKVRRKSKGSRNAPFSPNLRAKDTSVDLMFDMDEDVALSPGSPSSPLLKPSLDDKSVMKRQGSISQDLDSVLLDDEPPSSPPGPATLGVLGLGLESPSSSKTRMWHSPALPSSKLDLKEIMSQASASRVSNLSKSLLAETSNNKPSSTKLSQKERKRLQQQALQEATAAPQISGEKSSGSSSPWQVPATGPKTSLKEVFSQTPTSPLMLPKVDSGSLVPSRPLTTRRTASPDTRFSGQQRNTSRGQSDKSPSNIGRASQPVISGLSKSASAGIHSKSYSSFSPTAEPSLQLSMADIIGQQKREQEVIKEAVAKRSLQEIQEEQAFQEWWDQESRRTQEEEAARAKSSSSGSGRGSRDKGGSRGRGRNRGDSSKRGRGRGLPAQ